jgi:hypothetical protein
VTDVQMMPDQRMSEPADADKPIVHTVCRGCYPMPGPADVGMCGTKPARLAVHPTPPPDRPMCTVCADLAPKTCERCGL